MSIEDRNDHSTTDPNWRWKGQPVTGEKTAASGARARRFAFNTIEEFAAWRRAKGFPTLSQHDLELSFAHFRGEPFGELAVFAPATEKR